ncbi:hypothetical protein K1719_019384 [Acacia pycnantha]|nr:hypothetical protein K1719_019384 [Acacia pycnantha]
MTVYESLEWDKLCDLVASFATTSLRAAAVKSSYGLESTYDNSLRLLKETNVAVEMHKHGGCRPDFGHIDAFSVESAIRMPGEIGQEMALRHWPLLLFFTSLKPCRLI